jgi:lysophospholipase
MAWLGEGLRECRSLRLRPTPQTPTLTFLGTDERIVDVEAISDRMARWPNGTLRMVQDAEHEVLMEIEATRKCAVLKMVDHFNAHQ